MLNTKDSLLLSLYASPLQPAHWADTLNQVCHATGASSAALQVIRPTRQGIFIEWSATDSRSPSFNPPPGVADEGNPRWERRRMERTLGKIVRDDDLFDPHESARTCLQKQLESIGLGRFLGSLQQIGRDTFMGIALHQSLSRTCDYSSEEVETLAMLLPHLAQAYHLQQRLSVAAEPDRQLRDHLDCLQGALLICHPDGAIYWMNQRAGKLLQGSSVLCDSRHKISAVAASDNHRLQREIRELAVAASGETRYLAIGTGTARLHIALRASEQRHHPTVLLALSDCASTPLISAAAIGMLFDLTAAESRLVAALAAGISLEQYAVQRGISLGTVRGQLKQIFAKINVSRQSELVRLVWCSSMAQVMASAPGSLG